MRDVVTARRVALATAVEALIASATLLVLPGAVQACAVCWGSSSDHSFTSGILFLMIMPFTIVASIGGWLVYRYRRPSEGDPQKMVPARPFSTTQVTQEESRN